MIDSILSTKIRVTIETQDGYAFSGPAIVAELSLYSDPIEISAYGDIDRRFIHGSDSWKLNLKGSGTPFFLEHREVLSSETKTHSEWKCSWCGIANPKKNVKCPYCGGPRSFLYD